ncbi:hypothetical protein DFH09DRAFT_1174833 [Mycena vulgaris]|nr:hypothetical protein DFH09DRAFT_1174833 [Mycena vulgaris]
MTLYCSLLEDINHFAHKESGKKFFKALLQKEGRISDVDTFYRRIGMIINEFQITSLVNVQGMLKKDERARIEDAESLATRLDGLERNQRDLREALDVNQSNMIAMMQFYAHALEYLSSSSGKRVEAEDWMIPAFEVDYGPEIGSGGFGTVYRVAIKCSSFEGMKPNISVWLNLRHPNILQFLGANTLDDKPFNDAICPIQRATLRDISLGLEYLHSRKICHGDLKGINVLVDDLGRAQLCDFGLTRIKADITSRTAQIGNIITSGSRNWMAPEMFAGSPARLPSDIYAAQGTPTARHVHDTLAHLIKDMNRRAAQMRSHSTSIVSTNPSHSQASSRPLAAGELGVKLVDNQTTMLGDDDPDTRARALGNDHPDTLRSMSSLAVTYQRMGQWTQAEELQTRILGQDHPETLISMHNLSEAARLQEFVTDSRRRILGADHPDTLSGMFSLAGTYHKLGQFQDAEDLAKLVVEKRGQTFGREHPATLSCMFSLAGTYHKLGKFREAGELTAEALGAEHPETLLAMHNLAVIYYAAGKLEDAIQLAMDVIDREEQVLGGDHPYTRGSTRLLDQMLQSLG